MSKHYLAAFIPIKRNFTFLGAVAVLIATFLHSTSVHAQIPPAYTDFNPLSTQTTNLSFGTGTQDVTAPGALPIVVGINTDKKDATLGNGWKASAAGAISVGAVIAVYQSKATTTTTGGKLIFGSEVSGVLGSALSNLATLNTFMSYTASKQIAPVGAIATTGGSKRYAYNFDLAVNNGLLGLNADLLGSLTVSAWSGTTHVASASVFPQLLGLTSVTNTFYDNVRFVFDYDTASGPLEIRWSSNLVVNASLLQLLTVNAGKTNVYTISDNNFGYLTPIPEPSSLVLCVIGFGLFLRRNRPDRA